jgi:NAD(P)H-dependent FMN reductase
MVSVRVTLLLLSGSTRTASTNSAALRTAAALAPDGVRAVLYEGLADLPAFVPDTDPQAAPPSVAELRGALAAADAVLVCTPEYAGTLPGSFKNLLDWTVGTGDLYGKPVAWVTVAAPGRGEGATSTLRTVLGYVGADIVENACVRAYVARDAVGPDGLVTDAGVRAAIVAALAALAGHAAAAGE